jgi:hypothetical protein
MKDLELPSPVAHKHHDHLPYWKRAHHDWRFWTALFLMFAALSIYVWSDNLTFAYRGQPRHPMPADVAE